jgi:hypothetical protein
VNGTLFVQGHATVKIACSTEQIQTRLAVVALVGVVDLRLRQEENLRSKCVPFDLRPISLVERFDTRGRAIKSPKAVYLDASRPALHGWSDVEDCNTELLAFFSAINTAIDGFKPGLREILVAPSTLSLSTIPFDHSDGLNTWMSCPTSRAAWASEMVYWTFQPSWDFWVKDASCSPVDTEKTRRFLCWAPSSNLTVVTRHEVG